jgi:hypothetical protein
LKDIQKSAKPNRIFLCELEKCLQQKVVRTEDSVDPVNCRHSRTNFKRSGDQWLPDTKKKLGEKSLRSIFPAMLNILGQEPPSKLQVLLFHPSFAKILEKVLKFLKEHHSAQDCIFTKCFSRLSTLPLRDLAPPEAALRQIWAENECVELTRWLSSQTPALGPLFTKFGREMVVSDLKDHFSSSKFCSFKLKVNHKIAMNELQQEVRSRDLQREEWIDAIQKLSTPFQDNHNVQKQSISQRSNIDEAFCCTIQNLPGVVRRSHELCRQSGRTSGSGIQPIRNIERRVVLQPSKVSKEVYAAIQKLPEVVRRSHELCKSYELYDNMDNDFGVVQAPVPRASDFQPQMAHAAPSSQPYAEEIQAIIAMGFNDIDFIKAALSAESGNIQRAVECLLR